MKLTLLTLSSIVVPLASSNELYPRQIHLATIRTNSLSVTYTTDYLPTSGPSSVQFWPFDASPTTNATTATGSNVTFQVPIAWDETSEFIYANISHNLSIHTVEIGDLAPKSSYSYRVGSDESGWSNVHTLHTLPTARPTTDTPLSFAVVGDFGIRDVNARTLPALQNKALKRDIDFVLHIGDIAYDLDLERGKVGDDFMAAIEPISSSMPYMACMGNHEFNYNFTAFTHRFGGLPSPTDAEWATLPDSLGSNVGGNKNNWFYSFDVSNVHFVSLSTELVVDILDVTNETRYGFNYPDLTGWQHDWLIDDLEKDASNAATDWLVVYSHHPFYCSNVDDDCRGKHASAVREGVPGHEDAGLEETLVKYGADLYLSGHVHMYERMLPAYKNKTNSSWSSDDNRTMTKPGAPVHIVSGSGGGPEGTEGFNEDDILDFSVTRIADYSFSKVIVYNETHLKFEQWGTAMSDASPDGDIVDWMWIVK